MSSPAAPFRGGPALRPLPTGTLPWALFGAACALGAGLLVASGNGFVLLNVALVVAAALALARWPRAALLVVLALLPRDSLFLEATVAAAGLLLIVLVPRRLPAPLVCAAWAVLLLLALNGLHWQPDPDHPAQLPLPALGWQWLPPLGSAAIGWLRLCFVAVAFVLAARGLGRLRGVGDAFLVTLVASLWPLAVGLREVATGRLVASGPPGSRGGFASVESLFSHPNGFGFYLVVVIGVALVCLMRARATLARVALLLLLALAAFLLLHTYTRSAWIGAAALLVVMGIWRWRSLLVVGGVALVLSAVAFPHATRVVQQRFGDLSSKSAANASNSWKWRTGEWSQLLPLGQRHPLTGTGFESYAAQTVDVFGFEDPNYPTRNQDAAPGFAAHNDYVKMFVELGYPGVVLWVLILVGTFVAVARRTRDPVVGDYAVGLAALLLVFIVISFSDNVQTYTVSLAYPLLLAGALLGARRASSDATADENRSARSSVHDHAASAGGG